MPTPLPSTDLDDPQLARRVGEGDATAFNEIYRRHWTVALRLCRALLGCEHDAADATQQTFIKLFKRLSAGHVPASTRAYVICIARHESFELMRGRRPALAIESAGEVTPECDHAPALVDSLSMREAVGALPERYRKVLVMRGVGLSYDEIGDELSLSRNAVAQLLFRARTRITAELA
jgi:RNA polymerase sigma-70 factor (ECF subfamily)